jgi:hypothetical protein
MQKTKVPQPAPVGLGDPLQLAFEKVCAFDRLHDDRLALRMSVANVGSVQRAFHRVLLQLKIHRGQTVQETFVGIAGLVVRCEGHADR